MPSVAVMVRDDAGRLLLVRDRATGLWQTVGGAMDPGEEPAEAAMREAFEETGLVIEPVRILGVHAGPLFRLTYPNADVVDYVGISFAARVVGGTERPCHDEVDRLGWFAEADAMALPAAPHTRLLIAEAFRDAPEAAFAARRPSPPG